MLHLLASPAWAALIDDAAAANARGDYAAAGVGNKLLDQREIRPQQSLRLLEAVVARPTDTLAPEALASHQVLEVLLPSGTKLLIANAPQVALAAQLIAALAKPC